MWPQVARGGRRCIVKPVKVGEEVSVHTLHLLHLSAWCLASKRRPLRLFHVMPQEPINVEPIRTEAEPTSAVVAPEPEPTFEQGVADIKVWLVPV